MVWLRSRTSNLYQKESDNIPISVPVFLSNTLSSTTLNKNSVETCKQSWGTSKKRTEEYLLIIQESVKPMQIFNFHLAFSEMCSLSPEVNIIIYSILCVLGLYLFIIISFLKNGLNKGQFLVRCTVEKNNTKNKSRSSLQKPIKNVHNLSYSDNRLKKLK